MGQGRFDFHPASGGTFSMCRPNCLALGFARKSGIGLHQVTCIFYFGTISSYNSVPVGSEIEDRLSPLYFGFAET